MTQKRKKKFYAMKKILFLLLFIYVCLGKAQQERDIIHIPDTKLKKILLENTMINTNNDLEISKSEAESFTGTINISNKQITDLTGIEAFTNLTELNCSNNQLTRLDISKNTLLTSLNCDENQLTTLDTSHNTNLKTLNCSHNRNLNSINVSNNTALTTLNCSHNNLSSINIDNNKLLEKLDCSHNYLSSINVSNNTKLDKLDCSHNTLTSLDVSKNINLKEVYCFNNNLSDLDFSQNTHLTTLYCYNNDLTSLNIANGNNSKLTNFLSKGNTCLTCIKVDEGSTQGRKGWEKDNIANYNTHCDKIIVEATVEAITPTISSGEEAKFKIRGNNNYTVEYRYNNNDPIQKIKLINGEGIVTHPNTNNNLSITLVKITNETGCSMNLNQNVTSVAKVTIIKYRLYVKVEGTGDGSSWNNATNLINALSYADNNKNYWELNKPLEIWVAKGEYMPPLNQSFSMFKNVKIYGGFSNEGNPTMQQRNYTENETILKGNGSRVITNDDNGIDKINTPALLDGFIITGGTSDEGGGIYNKNSSPTISNCIIKNNKAVEGAGAKNEQSSAIFQNVTFIQNRASVGGGMYNNNANVSITDCTFSENTSQKGGNGVYNFGAQPKFTNCTFDKNKGALYQGSTGNIETKGGGIYNENASSIITNCKFTHNETTLGGGGIYNKNSSPKIINCTLSGNTGGIYNEKASPKIYNTIILGNTTTNGNTGIYNNSESVSEIKHSLVEKYSDNNYNNENNKNINAENITPEQIFINPTNENYMLRTDAIVINKGKNTLYSTNITSSDKDLAKNSRLVEEIIDMGAYEFGYYSKPPLTPTASGNEIPTYVGISTLNHRDDASWMTNSKNGFIKLESRERGFVITRMTTAQIKAIKDSQEGMLVWNKDENCIQLYSDSTWKCINPANN